MVVWLTALSKQPGNLIRAHAVSHNCVYISGVLSQVIKGAYSSAKNVKNENILSVVTYSYKGKNEF